MNKTILVVDDDALYVEAIDVVLKVFCFEGTVINAYDGIEALEVIADTPIDLIILNYMMPNLDGLGVLREIRMAEINTPVILTSALRLWDMPDELDTYEHVTFMEKAIDPEELIYKVYNALDFPEAM